MRQLKCKCVMFRHFEEGTSMSCGYLLDCSVTLHFFSSLVSYGSGLHTQTSSTFLFIDLLRTRCQAEWITSTYGECIKLFTSIKSINEAKYCTLQLQNEPFLNHMQPILCSAVWLYFGTVLHQLWSWCRLEDSDLQ